MKKHKHRRGQSQFKPLGLTFTLLDELTASASRPMPVQRLGGHMLHVFSGIDSLVNGETPTRHDWAAVTDAVNIMEGMVATGAVQDPGRLTCDATKALALAGMRMQEGEALRLDADGIAAMDAFLADYKTIIASAPERDLIRGHRHAERRVREILRGRVRPGDVVVML